MNTERNFERAVDEWLNEGSDRTAPHVIDAVLLAVRTTPQEWDFRLPWRNVSTKSPLNVAAVIALLVVAGLAAIYVFGGPGSNVGSGPTPSPTTQATPSVTVTPTPSARVQPTEAPSGNATPNASPIDTTSWTTYTSERYNFTIGHPADWTVVPAQHDWTMAADAADWLSPAQEAFIAPGQTIRVSAWSVAVDRATTPETPAGVEAWIEEYCAASLDTACGRIMERAVPLCVERRDCHPGLLVPFHEDVQAFFTGGIAGDEMVVVAVWRPDSDPGAAQYGGSQRLLEAFLSTMDVCQPLRSCPGEISKPVR